MIKTYNLLIPGCASLSSIWERFEQNKDITTLYKTKSILKRSLFNVWQDKNWLTRGRAFDVPKFKKSGYKVNVEEAYKDRLPFALTFLNPLPSVFRHDYVYHLLLIDRALPYKIFNENFHKEIDLMNLEVTDLLNKKTIGLIEIHKQLIEELIPNKELEIVIEDGEDFFGKKRFSIKRKLNDYLKETNTEENNESVALNKLSKATGELLRESFKEIPLN